MANDRDIECECWPREEASNPERLCSQCDCFIPFAGPAVGEPGITDFVEWAKSMQCEPTLRCVVCWKGEPRCTCERPTFLHDVVPPR